MDLCFPCSHQHGSGAAAGGGGSASTGACGIHCRVCRLHVRGLCSACGPANSVAAREKLEAQKRLLGACCPILECAHDRGIGHCLRDCDDFPCERLSRGPYPFSAGFLEMQRRRRGQLGDAPAAAWPETAGVFWERLAGRNPQAVCRASGASPDEGGAYRLQCLGEAWRIDPAGRTVRKVQGAFGGEWDRQMPFLILVYLAGAQDLAPSGEMVAPRDLYEGPDIFQGKYAIETAELESAFGRDGEGFVAAGKRLGGEPLAQADTAFRLRIFPRFAVDYLLWLADEELPAKLTILVDRTVPRHVPADATAVAINLLSRRLLLAAED